MNGFGKLRRCTEKAGRVVDFYLFLAAAFVVVRRLIQRARTRYRWPGRPTTRQVSRPRQIRKKTSWTTSAASSADRR